MNFEILIRSYKRPKLVITHTLGLLAMQDRSSALLKRTTVLVSDEEQKQEYESYLREESIFSDVKVEVTAKGAGETYRIAFSRRIGQNVFCIDDDMKEFYEYSNPNDKKSRKVIKNLEKYLEYGFSALKTYDAGAFSFDYTNIFYKQNAGFISIGTRRIPGGFFGLRITEELVYGDLAKYSHEEDNIRSVILLEKYSKNVIFNWFDVKMSPMFNTEGGQNATEDRSSIERTRHLVEELLKEPVIRKYFLDQPTFVNDKFYSLKMKPQNSLRKELGSKYFSKIDVKDYFGEFVLPQESEPIF